MRLITTLDSPGEVTNWLETCGHSNTCKIIDQRKIKDLKWIAGITLFDNTIEYNVTD